MNTYFQIRETDDHSNIVLEASTQEDALRDIQEFADETGRNFEDIEIGEITEDGDELTWKDLTIYAGHSAPEQKPYLQSEFL